MSIFKLPDMKSLLRFLLIVLGIVLALFALDRAFGAVMDHAVSGARGGDTRNLYYISNCLDDSVVIMGSSRANHHYVPQILADSLRMSVYNAGTDANGIMLASMQLNNMLARGHRPALIVYDYFPKFDLADISDLNKPLQRMRPYAGIPGMAPIIDDIDPVENIKLKSSLYRYNSGFIQILSDYIRPRQEVLSGYKPLYDSITTRFPRPADVVGTDRIDSVKVRYLRRFADICRREGIGLVFVISPYYFDGMDFRIPELRDIVGPDIPLIDLSDSPAFVGQDSLFADPSHLNDCGASLFTSRLLDSLTTRGIVHERLVRESKSR